MTFYSIEKQYLISKQKAHISLRNNFIKNNLFLINKSDYLHDAKEKTKIKEILFNLFSKIENNLNESDMNISFFSGKYFMHYLEIYNNYIETLENNPNLFFLKNHKRI